LEGKIVSLPKPLAVLQRVCAPSSSSSPVLEGDSGGDGDVDMQHGDDDCGAREDKSTQAAVTTTMTTTSSSSYAIRTLIRKKIVFSKRPTPIVGLSAET
jgi:chromosome transmission fidelity protein 8